MDWKNRKRIRISIRPLRASSVRLFKMDRLRTKSLEVLQEEDKALEGQIEGKETELDRKYGELRHLVHRSAKIKAEIARRGRSQKIADKRAKKVYTLLQVDGYVRTSGAEENFSNFGECIASGDQVKASGDNSEQRALKRVRRPLENVTNQSGQQVSEED